MTKITKFLLACWCLIAFMGISHAAQIPLVSYGVVAGDNLTSIARKFGLPDHKEIVGVNNIANPNRIYAGSMLLIPQVDIVKQDTPIPTKDSVENAASCTQGAKPEQSGIASWYGRGDGFHGKRTANGEIYDMRAFTVAHPTLPFGTTICISRQNGKSVVAKVNDRGPYVENRIIDVSESIAEALDFKEQGLGRVHITVLRHASASERRYKALAGNPVRKAVTATHVRTPAFDRVATKNVATPPRTTSGYVEPIAKDHEPQNVTQFIMHALRNSVQFFARGGDIPTMTESDLGVVEEIKRTLEDASGNGVNMTPLAVLIWNKKYKEKPPPDSVAETPIVHKENFTEKETVATLNISSNEIETTAKELQ